MARFFLACTPRTGNLWFRRLLASSLGSIATAAHSPDEVDWASIPRDAIVAMHWHFSESFHAQLARDGFSPIVTVRHPLDVLISILQFSQHEPATAQWLKGEAGDETCLRTADPTSPEFLEYALSDRAAALLSVSMEWLDHAVSIIRYEELVKSPERVLSDVIDRIGETAKLPVADVVGSNSLESLRAFSRYHFWRGQPGLWKFLITRECGSEISRRHRAVFSVLGYDCEFDAAPTPEMVRETWRALSVSA